MIGITWGHGQPNDKTHWDVGPKTTRNVQWLQQPSSGLMGGFTTCTNSTCKIETQYHGTCMATKNVVAETSKSDARHNSQRFVLLEFFVVVPRRVCCCFWVSTPSSQQEERIQVEWPRYPFSGTPVGTCLQAGLSPGLQLYVELYSTSIMVALSQDTRAFVAVYTICAQNKHHINHPPDCSSPLRYLEALEAQEA